MKFPLSSFNASDATTEQNPFVWISSSTRVRKASSEKGISGSRITDGPASPLILERAEEAASHPAWRPMDSRMKTFVEEAAMDFKSFVASRMAVAVNLAAEPYPGQ